MKADFEVLSSMILDEKGRKKVVKPGSIITLRFNGTSWYTRSANKKKYPVFGVFATEDRWHLVIGKIGGIIVRSKPVQSS